MKINVAAKKEILNLTTGDFSDDDVDIMWELQSLFDAYTDTALELDEDSATLDDIHDDLCKLNASLRTLIFCLSKFEKKSERSKDHVKKED